MPVALEKKMKKKATVLCISPLVALMQDQVSSAEEYGLRAVHLSDTSKDKEGDQKRL